MEDKKTYVEFTCNGKEYKRFDRYRPYFVVDDGEIVSCHETYRDAAKAAPYTGNDLAGKKGGPAMTTSEAGLSNLGIENPIPTIEEEPAPHADIMVPECISAPWYQDVQGMWRQRSRKAKILEEIKQ
jgi:hypothetical protein